MADKIIKKSRAENAYVKDYGVDHVSLYHYRMACQATTIQEEEYHFLATFNRGIASQLLKETFQRKIRNKIFTSQHLDLYNPDDQGEEGILVEISPVRKIPNFNPNPSQEDIFFSVISVILETLPETTEIQKFIISFVILNHQLYEYVEPSLDNTLEELKIYLDTIIDSDIKTISGLTNYLIDRYNTKVISINKEWKLLFEKMAVLLKR